MKYIEFNKLDFLDFVGTQRAKFHSNIPINWKFEGTDIPYYEMTYYRCYLTEYVNNSINSIQSVKFTTHYVYYKKANDWCFCKKMYLSAFVMECVKNLTLQQCGVNIKHEPNIPE